MITPFTSCDKLNSSPMEKCVMRNLRKFNIRFYREVSFKECINPITGCLLRYDFYIPEKNVLVEYDGKGAHKGKKVKDRDLIKTNFAKSNKIPLIRLKGGDAIRLFIEYYLSHTVLDSLTFDTRNDITKKSKNKVKYEPFVDPIEILTKNAKEGDYTKENCPF